MKTKVLLLTAIILLLAVSASFATPRSANHDRNERRAGRTADDLYLKITENFSYERYNEVDKLSRDYEARIGRSRHLEDVLYLHALSLTMLGKGDEARTKYRELEAASSNVETKASAAASVGDSYMDDNRKFEAQEVYKRTLDAYPTSSQADYLKEKIEDFGNLTAAAASSSSNGDASTQNSFFSVQVGSFSKSKNARALTDTLKNRGHETYMDQNGRMYRVRVGHFSTKVEAETKAVRLKKEGLPTKVVFVR